MLAKKRSGGRWTPSRLGKHLSTLSLCGLLVYGLASLPTQQEVEANPIPAAVLPDFSTLAEQASPSIVNISTTTHPKRDRNGYAPYADQLPELLRRYFGLEIPDLPQENQQPRRRPRSLGSGFIISKDGYVLTNNHVIEGADEIIVRMNDRSEYKAKLIGADSKSDLALLKVEVKGSKGLPAVTVGTSDILKPGQWVFAIGSPFGFDYSVTKGIISALNRTLPTESYVPFIQTDVPINPGNSGGPLLNMKGQVVGINSQIYTRSGGFMGLSFAIPIDDAMDVVKQLKESGQVTRGWLGVLVQDVDRNLAESFGLTRPHGALLSQVVPDGPAAKAGFKAGDIIIRFNGRDINFSGDLPVAVGRAPVGKKVDVVLMREGKEKTLQVIPGELPEEGSQQPAGSSQADGTLGLSVTDLTDDIRSQLKLPEGQKGVVVLRNVQAYGIQRGDLITDVVQNQRQQPVTSVKAFRKIIQALPKGQPVSVRVVRDKAARFVTIRRPE